MVLASTSLICKVRRGDGGGVLLSVDNLSSVRNFLHTTGESSILEPADLLSGTGSAADTVRLNGFGTALEFNFKNEILGYEKKRTEVRRGYS